MPHLRRPRPVAFVVSLLIAWLVLGLLAFGLRRGPIEKNLAERASDAVRRAGAAHIEVTVTGTVAILHGDFASPAAAQAALRAAKVDGVSSARLGDDALVATRPARPLVLTYADGQLTVRATVPDPERRAALLADVADVTGGRLTSDITVDPSAGAPQLPPLAGLVTALTRAPGTYTLTVDGSSLALTGTVANESTRVGLGAAVLTAGRAGDAGVVLDNQLVIAATGADEGGAGGTPAGGESAEAALAAATAGHPVTFAPGSAALSAADRASLDGVAAALRAGAPPALVAGHADSTGPVAFNQTLSLRRAEAAVAYLVSKGVPPTSLRAVGFGSSRPAADNATAGGRATNRRVEITFDSPA
ncbi:OmpA family protein [Frankia nepalensis]|nr:OmpA family protein [Frankia nepalensis]